MAAKVPEGTKLADKQTLIRNNGTEPSTLDPQLMNGVPESALGAELFEGLTITGANGEILPGVAESWHTDDNKIWVFKLRKDAKWSNGDPVTAHDFVYSFRRLVNPKTLAPYASYLNYANLVNSAEIASGKKSPESLGVKALDDYTLELTLSEVKKYHIYRAY
ncbi:ABC transporter substrate-binding protein [Bartonella sp. DGB1]|uniref:ABC transporter substrate-binding protein n=1 Tax=Bartonella sp. DGB1 TaxID=3239807 RepID=UPI0035240FC2